MTATAQPRRALRRALAGRVAQPPDRVDMPGPSPSISVPVATLPLSSLIPNPSVRMAVRVAGLGVALSVSATTLRPGVSGVGVEALAVLVVAAVAWLAWVVAGVTGASLYVALVVMSAAGGVATSIG
ncbi:MAG: hypothetical protein ACYDEY_07675 [Acidimicrobiales bacterium]